MKLLVVLAAFTAISAHANTVDSQCPNLTLTCEARVHDTTLSVDPVVLVDENWDEPSLKNCANTTYLQLEKTGEATGTLIRLHAQKELSSNKVSYDVQGIRVWDTKGQNGTVLRHADYSNTTTADSVVGAAADLGTIHLNKAVVIENQSATDLAVTCTVK